MSHSTCTHRGRVDSQLLVVGSQIASLTPGLSFCHNLCCKFPNGSCKAIFDIYNLITFQCYEERLKARFFDPWNRALKFQESWRIPKSPFRECECHLHILPKVGLRQKGYIKPSKSPYGAPIFFVHKKDGTLKMCVDYKALNKVIVKNQYPLPRIDDLFDWLLGAEVFSRIDLHFRYYQIWITERDEKKTTHRTGYGSYEFLVMPFGLFNAPAMFCTLMNDIFWEWLDDFMVIYINNIFVCIDSMEEHVEHLWKVFQRLRENKLYAKFKKCEFGVAKVDFLGHRITQEGLKMDDHKVKEILDWEPPRLVLALRSFLIWASYYRKFIKNFAKITTPLTNLLKKSSETYEWNETCNEAFETLKGILVKAPVLKLSDFDKNFEIHFDASDFVIRRVLVQDGRPMAFESKKLNETKQRWHMKRKCGPWYIISRLGATT